MTSQHSANRDQRYCGSGDIMFLVVEEPNSTWPL